MRVVSLALLFTGMISLTGCNKESASAAPRQIQPQEVQWYQTQPAGKPGMSLEQITINPDVVHAGQTATVSVKLANVRPGTDITLSWFGPSGWNVADQLATATGSTMTFQVPVQAFQTPGRYHGELHADIIHLGEVTLTLQ